MPSGVQRQPASCSSFSSSDESRACTRRRQAQVPLLSRIRESMVQERSFECRERGLYQKLKARSSCMESEKNSRMRRRMRMRPKLATVARVFWTHDLRQRLHVASVSCPNVKAMPAAAESALSTSGLMLVLASKLLLRSGSGLVIRGLLCPLMVSDRSSRENVCSNLNSSGDEISKLLVPSEFSKLTN